ncbi:unnamed protein product [marine sediment metagenome]|uniref:Uncharacterized protein n=1 Tax=marine sediment metagenome TaxID=412755 RepID=X1EL61_9ZZZZ
MEDLLKMCKIHNFDELEARLPAWDPVAFDLTHNNRWVRSNFYEGKYYEL